MPPTRSTGASVLGADADELERAAGELRSAADHLDDEAGSLTASLRSVAWSGGVATRFVGQWNGTHRPLLDAASRHLRDAAARLHDNAAEQRRASGSSGGTWVASGAGSGAGSGGDTTSRSGPVEREGVDPDPIGPVDGDDDDPDPADPESDPAPAEPDPAEPDPAEPDPAEPDPAELERIDAVLGRLGLARSELEAASGAARRLNGAAADGLLGLLADERFAQFLKASRGVINVGQFATDLLIDAAEHPDLPVDDLIVHAIADAGVRLGLRLGAERGAEMIAGALTAAVLPMLGTVLAPLVSELAGAVAASLMGDLVEAVDGSTDFVDGVADRAVDVFHDLAAALGVVGDVVEAGVSVAADAADLVGDASAWLDDRAGDLIGGVGDAIGSAGGWLGDRLGIGDD